MSKRRLSLVDEIITGADRALRTLAGNSKPVLHEPPKPKTYSKKALSDQEKQHSAGLMRVNHSGEVCAQALYQGQALTAKLDRVKVEMQTAADEEIDHLAWCEERISSLGGRTSVLNPIWYGVSFSLGAAAGLISDKLSLGFVAATEEQVCKHLTSHLESLPKNDLESRAVVEQMLIDEEKHAKSALDAGGIEFPKPVKSAMTLVSRLMTKTSYHV